METLELLHAAADIGYQGVEMVPESLWTAVFDAGMQVATITDGARGGWNDPANHARCCDELAAALEVAKQHHIPVVITFVGNREHDITDAQALDNAVEGLRRARPMIEASGVLVTPELLNSKVDHPGYQCDHADWAFSLIRQIDSPSIKLLYDIYHAQIMDGDIMRTIERNLSLIGHLHTAGVPGRHDLDATQELHYPAICRTLAAGGYQGYLGQEFLPRGDAASALRAAYQLCDDIW